MNQNSNAFDGGIMSDLTMQKDNAESVAEQYLTFMLADETFGLEILNVKEIIAYDNLAKVPLMPDFIAGVINLRGNVVPVIDLSQRFAGPPATITKRTSIIILELRGEDLHLDIGIIVDLVNEVLDIMPEEIEPAPSFGTSIRTDFIKGMGKVKGKLLVLLDITYVLSIDELSVVGGLQAQTES
tara:strand:- start:129 stop:680 length:552 start_codon:yes stop_codon:yes gene_type:complete